MVLQLFNHRYYRVSNCCLGCRNFIDEHCSYIDSMPGHCFGFCLYDKLSYVQTSIKFDYDY